MSSKGLVTLLLLAGLLFPAPYPVLAQEEVQDVLAPPETPTEELEPVETSAAAQNPEESGPEEQGSVEAPELIEVVDPPAEEVLMQLSSEEEEYEEEEPELVWGCEMVMDNEGNEFEQCGMGYYRTLCGYNAGVEECITFFQFYEEEPDYFQEELDELFEFETLDLSLGWNGEAMDEGGSLQTSHGQLSWTLTHPTSDDIAESISSFWHPEFIDWILPQTTYWLHIYKGPLGDATLVSSQEIGRNEVGTASITLPEPGEYQIFVSVVTRDEPYNICAFIENPRGDLCPEIDPHVEPVTWFMRYGRICNTNDLEPAELCYNREHPESRPGHAYPLAFGHYTVTLESAATGPSNVLFLPGIKGSRLYKPSSTCDPDLSLSCPGVKLWEPTSDVLLQELFLTSTGDSGRRDIYTKNEDIVSEVLGTNFYASFVNQMNALRSDGTITDWKAVAYDWRLSLDDILSSGTERGDKIYYREISGTPYIEKTLKDLAATSPTGKVSIVAHSNGGLVAKRLMQRLEAQGDESLVDKIVFVGVPQSGAPQAIGALLFGYGEALPKDSCSGLRSLGWLCSLFGSRDMARSLAEHSPMAYHLLPSEAYFAQVRDAQHPVALFSASTMYQEERARYGTTIDSATELTDFLEAKDGGRTKPAASDIASANVLNSGLLSYGREAHESLDAWVPPGEVEVYQIAGWGVPTVSGIEFYEQRKLLGGYKEMYRPRFVEDGDGVVPVPSALMLAEGDNVRNFWVDLDDASSDSRAKLNHGNIFEVSEIRILLRDILLGSLSGVPTFVTETQPEQRNGEKLVFYLHSPLTLELYDAEGNHVGENEEGVMDEEIEGATYGEFGDVKYIIAPAGEYTVSMRGKASGTFSLDIQSLSGDTVTSSLSIADVPTTEKTVATVFVGSDLEETGSLVVDLDGDGNTEIEIQPEAEATVLYTEPPQATESDTDQGSQRSSSRTVTTANAPSVSSEPVPPSTTPPGPVTIPPETKPFVANSDTSVADASVANAPPQRDLLPRENIDSRSLTASVYDSVGADFVNWISDMLYNFFKSIGQTFTNLFVWR